MIMVEPRQLTSVLSSAWPSQPDWPTQPGWPSRLSRRAGRPTPGKAPSGQIRQAFENQLVLDYLDLAESLAGRFASRGRERDDLNQVAYLGLIKAARGFDETRGASFPAYAAPTITGELKRYLRDRCWMVRPPRHVQDLRTELLRCEPELAQALGRRPTPAELGRELGVSVPAVREATAAASSMRPDSLDVADCHGDGPPLAEALADQDLPIERLEELMCLNEAIKELSEPERELLYRRYFCEESQADLGRRFGISQMQVSRRLSKVLVRLQQRLSEADAHSNPRPRTASRTS
jgi:RNA polymerase sigma-B factor